MSETITKCPCCGGDIVENSKAFGCSNWNNKEKPCDFVVWKVIKEKKITKEQAIDICTTGRSFLIEGFKGKKGDFSAFLVIVDDDTKKCKKRIGFEFPEREKGE
jgi:DNA topoisomerase-3